MAFPATPLQVRVDLQIAGVWTDVTADALARDGSSSISITRGRSDEASHADPSTCTLSLKNQAGKYSPRYPMSPYYGVLGRNTPLRVGIGVPPVSAGAALTSPGTSHPAPSVNAEAAGMQFVVWGASVVGNYTAPGGFITDTERDGGVSTWGAAHRAIAAGATGAPTATFTSSPAAVAAVNIAVPGTAMTTSVSTTVGTGGVPAGLSVSATAGDYVLCVYGWSSDPDDRMAGAPADYQASTCGWMLLSDTGPSIGPRLKVFIRLARLTGTVSVSLDSTLAAGVAPVAGGVDCYGLLARISGVTDYVCRGIGEVSEWPPKWDLSGKDVWTPVTASGVMRRLGQGPTPLRSALFRELSTAGSLVAYWPLEDADASTSFASSLGGPAMTFLGTPTLAGDAGFACSDATPTFAGAGARGIVPPYPVTNQFIVGALMSFPAAGMVDESTLLRVTATGSVAVWTVKYDTGVPGFRVEAFDSNGVSLLNTSVGPWTTTPPGSRFYLCLTGAASGANVAWTLRYIPIVPGSDFPISQAGTGTISTATVGRVTTVTVGPALDLAGPTSIGHVLVGAAATALFTSGVWQALVAWNGELAGERVRRLCREERVPAHVQYEFYVTSEPMGPQRPGALLDLLRECEDADGGILYEPRSMLGIGYRTRWSLQNQSATMVLSYSGGHISEPFEPLDDDFGVVNDVTVTRVEGSSARASLDIGPMSTLPPPAGIGRYDTNFPLNVHDDDRLLDQASWRLHDGTWDEARYPSIRVDMARNPAMVGAVGTVEVGDLVTVTGLPAFVPPGPVDQLLQGYTETFGHPNDWDVIGNYSPAGPYRVGVFDDATYGRLDGLSSTLDAGVTSTATSVSVATIAGRALWTTTATRPTDFPFDITLAGETMTVTAIVGAASPQTFTVTRSVNGIVKSHLAGEQVHLARPSVFAL